jgi:signal transduction histidine kinase/predicted CoA-binding protein
MMREFLRQVPLFADLPDEDLDHLIEMADVIDLPAGEDLFHEGDKGDRAYVVKSGSVEVIKTSGQRSVLLAVRPSGTVIGEIALLEDVARTATVRARTDTSFYAITKQQFDHLLNNSPTASRILLKTVLARWRTTDAALHQSEKMAQLGTLTAGVAHELNNPAAAVKRGADQLSEALADYREEQVRVSCLGLDNDQSALLEGLLLEASSKATHPSQSLDALTRSDSEFALEEWLEEQGIDEPWALAPTLVELGFTPEELAVSAGRFTPEEFAAVVAALGATYNVYSLVAEVEQGASRLSDTVKALKSYSYLDQAPVQQVDIHEGIRNTLLILRSKLSGVRVVEEYDPNLPIIQGHGSELNQVWTNILDNAADALSDTPNPLITIRTSFVDNWVRVEIEDNGPGIPPDVMGRIFDPFFTTKPPGKGTGLGLDISYSIVVTKHGGDLTASSHPGQTTFTVMLPLEPGTGTIADRPLAAVQELDDETLREILSESSSIAVVGVVDEPNRSEYTVPAYLQEQGYRIIPINPDLEEVLGEKAYPDLLSAPKPIDVVQIFHPENILAVVKQAIEIGAKTIWMHEGIVDNQAAALARSAGLNVVMDNCMRATNRRLSRPASL